jgi:dGTPase
MINNLYSEHDFLRIEKRPLKRDSLVDIRTEFQHDRDRVVHSSPFRRLQNKTQVLFPGEYDFYRTRLTHSIEVAQLGRTIAHFINERDPIFVKKQFKIDQDLIEAICLAHDIGHPPFGHLGERVLNHIMDGPETGFHLSKDLKNQFSTLLSDVRNEVRESKDPGFEGNAQNLRIVENLAYSIGFKGRVGFNPTYAFWEGLIKYPLSCSYVLRKQGEGKEHPAKFIYDSSFRVFDDYRKQFFDHAAEEYKNYNFQSIENQVMEMADDIAYSILDIEDAFTSRFIGLHNFGEIKNFIEQFAVKHNLDIEKFDLIRDLKDYLSSKVQIRRFKNRFITLFIANIVIEKTDNFSRFLNTEANHRFDYKLRFKDPDLAILIGLFKELIKKFVYTTPHIKQLQYSLPQYVLNMFQAFYYHPEILPEETQSYLPDQIEDQQLKEYKKRNLEIWSRSRIICDHISGMTDHYFLKQYRKIFKVGEGNIMDIL